MHLKSYTLSEKYNSFIWTPMKTASSHVSFVFAHFDFVTVTKNINTNIIVAQSSEFLNFGHSFGFPDGHENMTFICSMRNPYLRVFSMFSRRFLKPENKPEINEFEDFFHETIEVDPEFTKTTNMFEDRIPDYILRSENLYEDYLKIPFVNESKLNQCGILEDICNRKINIGLGTLTPELYLTESVKNKIYKMFQPHFELFGYEK